MPMSRARRFRANLSDLFLGGDISGTRAASLVQDAQAAGTRHLSDLAHTPATSSNHHRDLLRRLSKDSLWPKVYMADIPVWCRRTMTVKQAVVPMLLPHEIVATFLKYKARGAQLSLTREASMARASSSFKPMQQRWVSTSRRLWLLVSGWMVSAPNGTGLPATTWCACHFLDSLASQISCGCRCASLRRSSWPSM